jgi:transcriptional regulator with XRE-family HTH domain
MVNRRNIKTDLSECENLAEYRFWILKELQGQLAIRARVPQSAISQLENGRTVPHTQNWAALAKAYRLSLRDFTRLLSGGIKHGTNSEGMPDAAPVQGTSAADDAARSRPGGRVPAGMDQPSGAGASAQDLASGGAVESVPA